MKWKPESEMLKGFRLRGYTRWGDKSQEDRDYCLISIREKLTNTSEEYRVHSFSFIRERLANEKEEYELLASETDE